MVHIYHLLLRTSGTSHTNGLICDQKATEEMNESDIIINVKIMWLGCNHLQYQPRHWLH